MLKVVGEKDASDFGPWSEQYVKFNVGKVCHPAELNPELLSEYDLFCYTMQGKGHACPTFMYWLTTIKEKLKI